MTHCVGALIINGAQYAVIVFPLSPAAIREGPLREAMVFMTVVSLLRDYPDHLTVQSGGLQALAHLLRSGEIFTHLRGGERRREGGSRRVRQVIETTHIYIRTWIRSFPSTAILKKPEWYNNWLYSLDSYAAATVVLQDDHRLILDSLERHRDNPAAVVSALSALEVRKLNTL